MSLSFLIDTLNNNRDFNRLLDEIAKSSDSSFRISIRESEMPLFMIALNKKLGLTLLILSCEPAISFKLYYRLQEWVGNQIRVYLFPKKQASGVAKNDLENSYARLSSLSQIAYSKNNTADDPIQQIIISDVFTAAERIISPQVFMDLNQLIREGMALEPQRFLNLLFNHGYIIEERVEVPGTFCQRGGIIDFYPMTSRLPVRLELTGNRIESLRLFDPKTQRSRQLINEMQFNLITDLNNTKSDSTLLDYFNADTLLIFDNCEVTVSTDDRLEGLDLMQHKRISNESDIENLRYVTDKELQRKINRFNRKLYTSQWNYADAAIKNDITFPFKAIPLFEGRMDHFIKDLRRKLEAGFSIFVVTQQNERIYDLLLDKDLHAKKISEAGLTVVKGGISVYKGSLDTGWTWDNDIAVFTDHEIFGWAKQERLSPRRPVRHHLTIGQVQEGSHMVHIDHGIGKFTGFSQMKNNGISSQYLVLEYAGGDRLYVPVDQIERVSLYVGGKDQTPSLSRLHTQEWTQTKARIRKSVQDIARDLLKLYAMKETTNGFAFSSDTIWQREIESSFPYIETPDQLKAVSEVKHDMETNKPMDRLICGDVGYGKTEIALRAAFKAVMDSKQVAVLVPTTVLAQQHYQTFFDRLQVFPVKLAVLSRFNSDKEQNAVIQGLANGSVDICIGTHRLLQQDVIFKRLGLLIIDEEQRFGVAHKEFFRRVRHDIDILSLSATPIPRTLHMSLTGIKDLSTLETPPEDRLPIETFVGPYNKGLVRDAILSEIRRGGQIFCVHNRVNNINVVAAELKLLVPECKIIVAHGQMPEEELENVMMNFIKHKADILLTTTIIESGIDIPSANTLIIDESEKLGLTQLYQLRGRIGRGANTAYAYFFYRADKYLTEQAKQRLATIAEATELGAGYAIAMKDLEIRGAGNLLGTEQSGYISAVGFDLYCRLLAEAVEELRKGNTDDQVDEIHIEAHKAETSIALPLDAYIPETYIPDINDRIWFYQRLARGENEADVTDIEVELRDRFGEVPSEVHNLIYVVKLKRYANTLGIDSIYAKKHQIVISFDKMNDVKQFVPHEYLKKHSNIVFIGSKQIKLDLVKARDNWQYILMELIQYISVWLGSKANPG